MAKTNKGLLAGFVAAAAVCFTTATATPASACGLSDTPNAKGYEQTRDGRTVSYTVGAPSRIIPQALADIYINSSPADTCKMDASLLRKITHTYNKTPQLPANLTIGDNPDPLTVNVRGGTVANQPVVALYDGDGKGIGTAMVRGAHLTPSQVYAAAPLAARPSLGSLVQAMFNPKPQ